MTSVLSCVISAKCRKRANVKVATFSAKLFPRGQYFHGEKKVDHVTRRISRPLTCPDWFADCYLQHPIHLQLSNFVLNWILLFGAFPGQWVPPQLSYRFNLNQVPRQISQSFYWNEATKPRKRAIVSTWSDTADKGKLEPFPVCHVLSMDKHFLLLLRHLFNGAWWLNFFQYRVLPMQIRIISLFVENDIQLLRASLNAPP